MLELFQVVVEIRSVDFSHRQRHPMDHVQQGETRPEGWRQFDGLRERLISVGAQVNGNEKMLSCHIDILRPQARWKGRAIRPDPRLTGIDRA